MLVSHCAALPSIVVYLSDDHSQFDSSLYGNANIPTPNFEKLAAAGITLTHAFVASPSCAPSRGAMLTGLMPARNGAEGNHTSPRPEIPCLIENLKALGYETAAFGKVSHGKNNGRYGFDHHFTRPGRGDALRDRVKKFLTSRDKSKPLCLFVGTSDPHVSWPENTSFDPAKVEFPPHHLDTPSTREHRARYYQEIADLDKLLGELRAMTDKHLGAEHLFIHTSDHGSQWPFGKWTLYDYGTRVPFIASWPGKIPPGTRSDAMVSWVDIIPTLIDAAGGAGPKDIDGFSFLPVLLGEKNQHREQIFTTHSGDANVNVYPSRAIRTREWKLIHNLRPDFAFTNHSDLHRKQWAGAYWGEWAALAKTEARAKIIVDRYYQRPEFELYRMDAGDKWEQTNLAEDPAHAETLTKLLSGLNAWMKSQGDTGRIFGKPHMLSDPESWHPDYFKTAAAGVSEVSGRKPNILIIVADDLGYADTGFNGSDTAKTPNLDRFAESGVKLTDFRACPMCSPTRAGLMTGRWPIRFGMMRAVVPPWSKVGLPASEETLPELLAGAGYGRRGIIGKWHLGHTSYSQLPLQNGFTRFAGHYNGAIDYFTHEREDELDWHDDHESLREDGYATDLLAQHATRFIKDSPAEEPWFLYVPFNAPHSPYQATEADLAAHSNIADTQRRTYAAMVTAMDRGIGQILKAVESRADADNTLVLFFSDNGGILSVGSNHPYRGAKLTVYEGGTRVCAAMRWPAAGLKGGRSFDGRIGYIDVLPSALAAAGIQAGDAVDGVNFLPALRGDAALPPRPWFSYMHQNKSAESSVHLGKWKLIAKGDAFTARPDKLELELYNLDADPGEKENLAKQNPQRVTRMLARLHEFGMLQKPGVTLYGEGREGFVAPKEWKIEPK